MSIALESGRGPPQVGSRQAGSMSARSEDPASLRSRVIPHVRFVVGAYAGGATDGRCSGFSRYVLAVVSSAGKISLYIFTNMVSPSPKQNTLQDKLTAFTLLLGDVHPVLRHHNFDHLTMLASSHLTATLSTESALNKALLDPIFKIPKTCILILILRSNSALKRSVWVLAKICELTDEGDLQMS